AFIASQASFHAARNGDHLTTNLEAACTLALSHNGRQAMSGEITHDRRHFLGVAAMGIIAHRLGLASSMMPGIARAAEPRSGEGELNALARATEWLNTTPLSATGLRGKVVRGPVCTPISV